MPKCRINMRQDNLRLINTIKDKKILLITTKNLDYIRVIQEINLLNNYSNALTIIGSNSKHYLKRIIHVFINLLLLNASNYDVIFIAHASQLVVPFFRHKFKNQLVIIDFFISLYDTGCFDRKYFKPRSLPGKILNWMDRITIEYGDIIICDTNAHRDYFIDEFNVSKEKLLTLYIQSPINNDQFKKLTNLSTHSQSCFHVLYFGSILPLQGVEIILNAIALFKNTPNIRFTIIGPINKKLKKIAPVSSNITYINWLSQSDLYKYIKISDLCLAGHFNSDIAKASRTIPGKAYIYQAFNKPMILGDNPANREVFSEDSPGIYYVQMGDHIELAKLIHSIYLKHIHQTGTLV